MMYKKPRTGSASRACGGRWPRRRDARRRGTPARAPGPWGTRLYVSLLVLVRVVCVYMYVYVYKCIYVYAPSGPSMV
jgi:hypothetical protein